MSDRFRHNYSANEPGDGCMTFVILMSVIVLALVICIFGVPELWHIDTTP